MRIPTLSIYFCVLILYGCSTTPSDMTEQPQAMTEIIDHWRPWISRPGPIMKVITTADMVDTMMINSLNDENIPAILKALAYSPRVRAGAFHIEHVDSMGFQLERFVPEMPSPIRMSTYGYDAERDMRYTRYDKALVSLLGTLRQSLTLDHRSGIRYDVIYEDRLTQDALTTTIHYRWIDQ